MKFQRRRERSCLNEPTLGLPMDSLGKDKVARLLRLKRYEQPPPGYFENFLHEFHRRRQRDELLREPLWSICVDRVRDFVFRYNVRTFAGYSAGVVTATACIVVIAITALQRPNSIQLAVQTSPVPNALPIMDKQSVFDLAQLDMQPTLLPGSADLLVLPASDEAVPLSLGSDSLDDQ